MKKKLTIYCDYIYPVQKAGAVRLQPFIKELQLIPDLTLNIVYSEGVPQPAINTHYRKTWLTPGSNSNSNMSRIIKEILLGFEFFFRILFSERNVTYLSSPPFFTILIASLACRIKKNKYILDVRDKYPDVFFESKLIKESGLAGHILKKLEIELVKHASIATTVTPGLVQKIGLLTAKVVLFIPNGYSEGFQPQLDKNSHFTIIFHGNVGRFQDIDLLLELAEHLEVHAPDIKIVAIGEGVKDHLLKNNNYRNLSYLGQLPLDDIAEQVNSAHLGISFRTNDKISIHSMPVKVFEYIGSGIPVVITPLSEAGEMIRDLQLGRQFQPEDKNEIFQFIVEVSKDKSLYGKYVENVSLHRHKFSRKSLASLFVRKIDEFIIEHSGKN